MEKTRFTDPELLSGMEKHDMLVVRFIYNQMFEGPCRFILSNSGTRDDASDIFQDALVIVYKKIISHSLNLTCSFQTYLFSVCRNLWLQRLDFLKKMNFSEQNAGYNPSEPDPPDHDWLENEKMNLLEKYILKLDEDCRKLILLTLKKIPLKEIAGIMRFSSVDYTKTKKYLCKNKLRKTIMEDVYFQKLLAYE